MFKMVFRNVLASGLSTGWRIAVSLLLTPYVIHRLGPDAYGVWVFATAFSVAGYLSILTLGVPAALVKRIAEHRARGEYAALSEAINASLFLFLGLGVAGCIGLILLAPVVAKTFAVPASQVSSLIPLLYVIGIQSLFDFPTFAVSGIVEGVQRYDVFSAIDVGRSTLFAIATVCVLEAGGGIVLMGGVLMLLAAANGAVLWRVSRRLLPEWDLRIRPTLRAILSMASLSGRMFILRISAVVYNQMDKAIIGLLLTTTALSYYDIANRIHSLVLVSQGLIASVTLPTSSALHALKDVGRLQELFLKGTKYTAAISVPLAIVGMILAKPLIHGWIGPGFDQAISLSRLFLSYLIFLALVHVGQNMMLGMDKVGAVTAIGSLGLVLNLAVSIRATQMIGMSGVIWGTIIGSVVSTVLYLRLFLQTLHISPTMFLQHVIAPVYPAAFGSGLILAFFAWRFPPGGLFATLLYAGAALTLFGGLFIVTGIDSGERAQLASLVRQRLANGEEAN